MENYTLFTHQADLSFLPTLLSSHFPKASVTERAVGDHDHQYQATIKGGFFSKSKTITLNIRYRPVPGFELTEVTDAFTQNLAGMIGFVRGIPAGDPELAGKLAVKIGSINAQLACLADPGLTPEMETFLRVLTQRLKAIVFATPGQTLSASPQQHFLDSDWRLLLDTEGNSAVSDLDVTVDARYYNQPREASATAGQNDRKAANIARLRGMNVPVLENLPVVQSAEDTTLPAMADVAQRMYATLLAAAKASGLPQEQVEATITGRGLTDISPAERAFIDDSAASQDTTNNFTWRYESANLLAWALGLLPELPPANTMVDTNVLVPLLMKIPPTEVAERCAMRSVTEILNELDLVYRMHWACVNARIKGEEAPAALHPGIVYERYYALTWLVNGGSLPWDEVGGALHS